MADLILQPAKRKRKYRWPDIRLEIIKRDAGICAECGIDTFKQENDFWNLLQVNRCMAERFARRFGASLARRHFREVDHIYPQHMGGTNDHDNLQTLCRRCHLNKTRRDRESRTFELENELTIAISSGDKSWFIAKALEAISPRKRNIVRHRLGLDGFRALSLSEMSDLFKLSRERIRQLEGEALTDICQAIRTNTLPQRKISKAEMSRQAAASAVAPPRWRFTVHQQIVLQARVYVYEKWRGRHRPWNKPFVCWAKRITGNRVEIFNTEGDTAQDALSKAARRVGYDITEIP